MLQRWISYWEGSKIVFLSVKSRWQSSRRHFVLFRDCIFRALETVSWTVLNSSLDLQARLKVLLYYSMCRLRPSSIIQYNTSSTTYTPNTILIIMYNSMASLVPRNHRWRQERCTWDKQNLQRIKKKGFASRRRRRTVVSYGILWWILELCVLFTDSRRNIEIRILCWTFKRQLEPLHSNRRQALFL